MNSSDKIQKKVLNKFYEITVFGNNLDRATTKQLIEEAINFAISETEKAKDEDFQKQLQFILPKNWMAKSKDDWEFETFRIRQQTANEIFAEIEKNYDCGRIDKNGR